MYNDLELKFRSTKELKEELRKVQQTLMYFEMADGPQYYREAKEREETKLYCNKINKELNSREKITCA